MERLHREQPAADRGAKPVLDVPRLTQARGRERIAQAAELGDFEAHGVDHTPGDEREYFVQGSGRLIGLHDDRHRTRDQCKSREIACGNRLLDQIEPVLGHVMKRVTASLGE